MGGVCKVLQMLAKEAVICCKQSLTGDSGQTSDTKILTRMKIIKTRLKRCQLGIRTTLAVGLVVYYTVAENVPTFRTCTETFQDTEIKGSKQIWWRKFPDSPVFRLWHR